MIPTIKDTDSLTIESLQDGNPRIMRTHRDAALGGAMDKWGDLGGITWNETSSRFVTGHQRMRKLKEKYGGRVKIYIEQTFNEPDEFGTVGLGYVGVEGTHVRFAYREVMFDEANERAAGLASNNATGENDDEMMARIDFELTQFDNGAELLALTGQSEKDIQKLLQSVGAGPEIEPTGDQADEPKESNKLTFALSPDQKAIVEQALAESKATNDIPHTNLDNINGTALYYICKHYVENPTSHNIETPPAPAPTGQDDLSPTTAPDLSPELTSIPGSAAE